MIVQAYTSDKKVFFAEYWVCGARESFGLLIPESFFVIPSCIQEKSGGISFCYIQGKS